MRVLVGQSRREKAEQRVVPVSSHLLDLLGPWLVGRAPEARLVGRRNDMRSRSGNEHLPSKTISDAGEAATRAG